MRILPALLVAAALAFAAPAASANMVAVFQSNAANTYNYTLRFTVDQPGEQLRSGDRITLVDVAPPAAISSATAPPGFTVALANSSPAFPGVTDLAGETNVIYTYVGATLTTPVDFGGATIVTSGDYTATEFGYALGTTSFLSTSDQASSNITVLPAPIPEPASISLLALGGLALLARRRSA